MGLTPVRLKPFHDDLWQKHVFNQKIADSGQSSTYRGDALTSIASTAGATLEATFSTSAIRPAHLQLPVIFTSAGSVEIHVDDVAVSTVEVPVPPPGDPLLRRILVDLSRCTARRGTGRLKLIFTFTQAGGTATVLLDASRADLVIAIDQAWSPSYAMARLSVLALLWLSLFGLLIVIAAHVPWFNEEWEQYALVTTAIVWLASLLGVADLAKLPVKKFIRCCFGWAMCHRRAGPASIGALAVLIVVVNVPIGNCVRVRARYIDHIEEYFRDQTNPEPLANAFALVPWRPDARFLIERHAWQLRFDEGPGRFHTYVRRFVASSQAAEAVRRSRNDSRRFCLYHPDENTIGPVEWLTSLMPEGETEPETKLTRAAVQLLSDTSGVQAKILRLTFELEVPPLVGGKDGVIPTERVTKELRDEIDATSSAGELFQLGSDRLGQVALETCNQDEALRRFKAILEARTRSLSGEAGVWLRPPEKLAVYQMYRAFAGMTGPYVAVGSELLDRCEGFRGRFRREVYDVYKPFEKLETWTQGTPFSSALKPKEYVTTKLLRKGWRY